MPTRTSPVIRGKWILDNMLGVPPPPPPANVPALEDAKTVKTNATDARAAGRAPGESDVRGLPQADGSGRLRARELRRGRPLAHAWTRASRSTRRARCSTARTFRGVAGLQKAILSRPELFVTTLSEKLLTFAIGRGVDVLRRAGDPQDRARRGAQTTTASRRIVMGIVNSTPFRMRKAS